MGILGTTLTLPVSGPLGAVGWLARQIAEAAMTQLLDPVRIETALLALARRLEAGEIDEATFEAEESRLLEELVEMRAYAADAEAAGAEAEGADAEDEPETAVGEIASADPPPSDIRPTDHQIQAEPWTPV